MRLLLLSIVEMLETRRVFKRTVENEKRFQSVCGKLPEVFHGRVSPVIPTMQFNNPFLIYFVDIKFKACYSKFT
jgi:hypothetical protein